MESKRACALHTVIGQNSRCRKELEPSRRLSETTGPQSPGAFRIAFWTTEVTDCAARCKHEAPYFTHCAPKVHTALSVPHGERCTCYRGVCGVVQCVHREMGSVHTLPLRTMRAVVRRMVRETRGGPRAEIAVRLLPSRRVSKHHPLHPSDGSRAHTERLMSRE